jgi:hypothetical protein
MELTGHNIYQTQQYLRHSNPRTTEIYLENDTAEQDEAIAQQLYQRYHGAEQPTSSREQLQGIIATMNPQQLEQLAAIAQAMQK